MLSRLFSFFSSRNNGNVRDFPRLLCYNKGRVGSPENLAAASDNSALLRASY